MRNKKIMKNPTLEQIKEMYPEGCEVYCDITNKDKQIVSHELIRGHNAGYWYLNDRYFVNLYCATLKQFATITKPAPESKKTAYPINDYMKIPLKDREKIIFFGSTNKTIKPKNNDLEKAIVNLIEVSRNLGLRASVTFETKK
tara:strand:+ start:442 stop:870 length:429 start_codon:yes stop_codon:yes gene_type:complete